jgi:hypothetical protein
MNLHSQFVLPLLAVCLGLLNPLVVGAAEAEAPSVSAKDLAAQLGAKQQDGSSYVRLRMQIKQPAGATTALQLQIKSRSTKTGTDLVYQVLWPKERKGEAVLLRKSGNRAATGAILLPPAAAKPLDAAQLKEPLFGSDLTLEDMIDNFFFWDQQALVGTEVVEKVNCQILESKPGKGERSSYTSVRTWVDTKRLVPLRVEKYGASGKLIRRIDTIKVTNDDLGTPIPSNLTVRGSRGEAFTELDGSRIKHGVALTDEDFTAEGLAKITAPSD